MGESLPFQSDPTAVFNTALAGMQQMMMVVPVDPDVDEAQDIAQENRDQGYERAQGLAVRDFELQHHDGDDDGDDAVAEGFNPGIVQIEFRRFRYCRQ
jgi:hypothetical protein